MKGVWLILVLSGTALGIGISPAEKEISILPGEVQEIEYRVINTERKAFSVDINISGDLGRDTKASPSKLMFSEKDMEKTFILRIEVPPDASGRSELMINLIGAGVSAKLSAKLGLTLPTGSVIMPVVKKGTLTGSKGYLLPLLLVMILVANVAWVLVGSRSKSKRGKSELKEEIDSLKEKIYVELKELDAPVPKPLSYFLTVNNKKILTLEQFAHYMNSINDDIFSYHLRNNGYSHWISDNYPRLHPFLKEVRSRSGMLSSLSAYFSEEAEREASEAKILKMELDRIEIK